MSPSTASTTAAAVHGYAVRCRAALPEGVHVRSYAGLWLLLATLGKVTSGPGRTALELALGISVERAGAAAAELLADEREGLDAAVAGWLRPGTELAGVLPVVLADLPDQAGLDRWARKSTHGLVPRLPLTLGGETVLVLANVLTARTDWADPLTVDDDDRLLVGQGLLAVVDTRAAGRVAVVAPSTRADLDVISVIASPSVPTAGVWEATDEVVGWVLDRSLLDRRIPAADLEASGHAWDVVRRTASVTSPTATETWSAALPAWSHESTVDLAEAPGVEPVVTAVLATLDQELRAASCVQGAAARYDAAGFAAAAVTVISWMAGSAQPEPRKLRHVTLTFDRPHAVVAVARGGAWEGIPVMHAWVDGTPTQAAEAVDR